ncbi:MAG: DUF362 domain-containing protein [Pseudomonadota bacterium]
MHRVAVVPAPPDRLREALLQALEAVDWRAALQGQRRVLLKPNLGFDLPHPGSVTSPAVLAAVVELLLDHGHEVLIIEADQVLVDMERAAALAGVPALCRRRRVTWVNLSRQSYRTVGPVHPDAPIPLRLPELIGQHPLIDLPVLKTHAKTTVSGAIKNLWGLLPKDRHQLHPWLAPALRMLLAAAPPALCVMDATVALEGDGPKTGTPRRVDHVLAARDAWHLDTLTARWMGFDPGAIAHLTACAPPDAAEPTEIIGELPPLPPFQPAGHNLVSRVEEAVRALPGGRRLLRSPALHVATAGAWVWYRVWARTRSLSV